MFLFSCQNSDWPDRLHQDAIPSRHASASQPIGPETSAVVETHRQRSPLSSHPDLWGSEHLNSSPSFSFKLKLHDGCNFLTLARIATVSLLVQKDLNVTNYGVVLK